MIGLCAYRCFVSVCLQILFADCQLFNKPMVDLSIDWLIDCGLCVVLYIFYCTMYCTNPAFGCQILINFLWLWLTVWLIDWSIIDWLNSECCTQTWIHNFDLKHVGSETTLPSFIHHVYWQKLKKNRKKTTKQTNSLNNTYRSKRHILS